ncbi:MAG: PH domain-containing protein [Pseudonocardiaceae bacterium]|nr:PH domain-containing protein [Pseudonocardiaceae bacterium]
MLGGVYAVSYAPKRLGVVAAWAGAGIAAGWAVLATDAPSRLLAVAAIGLLGILALLGTALRPRLAADADGIYLGRLRGVRHWPWDAVRRMEVVSSNRMGRRVGMLELDLDDGEQERLVVLTTLDLGVDPCDAEDALRALAGGG